MQELTIFNLYSFCTTFDQIAAGAIVALYYARIQAILDWKIRVSLTIVSSAGLLAIYVLTQPNDGPLLCDGVAICTAAIICSSGGTRSESNAPWRCSGGVWTAELRVVFIPPISILGSRPSGPNDFGDTGAPHVAAMLLLIASIGLTYAISHAISRFFSEPINRMIRGYSTAVEKPSGMKSGARKGAAVSE